MSVPLRVLIVEDCENDAMLLLRELRRADYDVTFERVDTPAAFTAALETRQWDIVIADYVMPQFSGLAALRLLRDKGLDLPFVVVSGAIGEDVAVEAMKAGAHDYLMKGNLARLAPAIERELRDAVGRHEHRRAEEAQRESEARYRAVVEDQTELICRFLPDGTLTFVNDAYCRYFGMTREELIGDNFIPLMPDEDHDLVQAHVASLSRENPAVTCEHRVVLPDGGTAWLQCTARAIFDESGNLAEYQSVGRDISERKQAEEENHRVREESEEAKRRFYKDTILAVTEGRLEICEHDEMTQWICDPERVVRLAKPEDSPRSRGIARCFLARHGVDPEEMNLILLCVGEAVTNALKHAGRGRLLLGAHEDGDIWIAVQDKGPGIDALTLPMATLMPGFSTKPSLGMGYSIILSQSDRVLLATGPTGTTVLIEKHAHPEAPALEFQLDRVPDLG